MYMKPISRKKSIYVISIIYRGNLYPTSILVDLYSYRCSMLLEYLLTKPGHFGRYMLLDISATWSVCEGSKVFQI